MNFFKQPYVLNSSLVLFVYVLDIIIIIIITYVKIRVILHKLNCCRGAVHEIRRRVYIMIVQVSISQSIKRNDLRKRAVLRSRRNVDSDVADLSAPGSAFHASGAATKNERPPSVELRDGGYISVRTTFGILHGSRTRGDHYPRVCSARTI